MSGLYVFHVGEEVGGVGSSYLAKTYPDKFHNIDRCIAFDHRGYSDVITHQAGGRCCSDAFANALCKQMNPHLPPMQPMAPSSGGTFTDSANYTHLIAECTNVAVGYFDQHTAQEKFDRVAGAASHPCPYQSGLGQPADADPLEFSASPRFQSSRGYPNLRVTLRQTSRYDNEFAVCSSTRAIYAVPESS